MTNALPTKVTRGPRGPYAKTAAIRERILSACVDAFSEGGFYAVTMKEIAQRAGISHTGLLHHFASKEELLDAVLMMRYEQTAKMIRDAMTQGETLQAQMEVIRDNKSRPGIVQLHTIVSAEAIVTSHPAHDYFSERLEQFRRHLTSVFHEFQRDGKLISAAEPEILANLYIAVLDGLQLQWLYNPQAVDVEEGVRAFLRSVVDIDF